eukprot:8732371-Lingulodinium_polyedra.AAC.1
MEGLRVPPALADAFAKLMPDLCAHAGAGASDPRAVPLAVMDATDPDFSKRSVLQLLASHGLAQELASDAVSSSWGLTPDGVERIRILRTLQLEGPALRVRPGVELMEASTLELLTLLQEG